MQHIHVSFLICYICSSHYLSDIVYGQTTYNVLNYDAIGDGETDDSQAFIRAWEDFCGADETYDLPTLLIPEGKTFLLQPTEFKGPCKSNGVHVQVLGKLVAPNTSEAWKECESNSWLSFTYVHNLTVNGSGQIDGRGSSWWNKDDDQKLYIDGNDDEEKKCHQPKALHFHGCHNLLLTGLTHVNSPKAHISISNCSYVYVANLIIIAPEESPNTDGIDISNSNHVEIHASYIGTGDDCIAINSGCSNLYITNIACGPGHGISVGSLGKDGAYATVENVSVKNCSFSGTQNGVRIKTWQGGSGHAKNIMFEQITLHAAKNPIIIDQYYCAGSHDCKNKSSAVEVSNVRYTGIHGTSAKEEAIRLDCDQLSGCRNIVMENINITSDVPGTELYASCYNINGTSNSTIPSITCWIKLELIRVT